MLRTPEVDLLAEEFEDTPPSAWEIGLTVDLTREDLDEDDREGDLGFRALYERPDLIRNRAWVGAH